MYSYRVWVYKNWQNHNSSRLLKKTGVQLALFWDYKKSGRSFKVFTSSKFKASWLKQKFGPILDEKSLNFEGFSLNSSQKPRIEQFNSPPLSLEIKSITLQLTILSYFSKIDKSLVKIEENLVKNVNKTAEILLIFIKFKPRFLPIKSEKWKKNRFNSKFYAGRAF